MGREVLFKKMALEELDRRYKKHEGSLLPEEREAVEQVIERFRNGAYRRISFKQSVGTFYLPFSLLFTALLDAFKLFFPTTQYLALNQCIELCKKDQRPSWYMSSFFRLCVVVSFGVIGFVIMDIIFMLIFYPLVVLVELVLLLCSFLLCYGFYMLDKKGVFVYSFHVNLVIAQACATRWYGDATYVVGLSQQDLATKVAITHAPLRRILCTQPLAKIFKDMDMETYTFGTLEGRQVAQEDVTRYGTLRLQQTAVQAELNGTV